MNDSITMQMNQHSVSEKDREEFLLAFVEKLQIYYDDEILGTLVDLVLDNEEDEYYLQLHSHQTLGIANFIKQGPK